MAQLLSGTRVYGNTSIDSQLIVGNVAPYAATSNTTGSLIVTGGVGVAGNIWVGGTNAGANGVYTDVLRYAANGLPWVMNTGGGGGGGGTIDQWVRDTANVTIGVDASQNVRLDFSNTRMNISDGVDASQNVRLDFSNTRMTNIQSGYRANTVIVANASGFLSNSNSFFLASNNAFITGNVTASRYNLTTTETALGLFAGTTQVGYGTAIGWYAGQTSQGFSSVAVGRESGTNNQGNDAVAIGNNAGHSGQGAGAIAIGYLAGGTGQGAGSIHLNANTDFADGDYPIQTKGLYIDPVRNNTANTANAVYYNPLTRELTYAPASTGGGGSGVAFSRIIVSGQPDAIANIANSPLTLVAGTNITIGTNGVSNTITINAPASNTTIANLSSAAAFSTYYIGLAQQSSGAWATAYVDTANLFYTTANGTLFVTNYNTSSDRNLKDDIITITDGLTTVDKLRGVSFKWKNSGEKSYGIIAQELEEILPDLVSNAGGHKSVNYNALIGFLIEAVKELSDRVDELEKK